MDRIFIGLAGIIAGIFFGMASYDSHWNLSKMQEVEQRIEICESSLPRDQNCIIEAIPDPEYKSMKE